MKKEILKRIDEKIGRLNESDVTGHIYWNEFKHFIQSFKPEKKTILERAEVFKNKILTDENKTKYPENMLKAFINYWTESNENGRKMRFEMQKVFDANRRLATWSKRSKQFNQGRPQPLTKKQSREDFGF